MTYQTETPILASMREELPVSLGDRRSLPDKFHKWSNINELLRLSGIQNSLRDPSRGPFYICQSDLVSREAAAVYQLNS